MDRILHVRQSARYGGLERLIIASAEVLGECYAYDVGLLLWYSSRCLPTDVKRSLPERHPAVGEATARGLWADQWPDRGKLAPGMVVRLVRLIRERGISLLHTHGHKSDVLGLVAARITGIPVVATAHGYHEALRRIRFYRVLDVIAFRGFARVIAVSEAFRRELIGMGVPASKVVTIHNAIDAEAFRLSASEQGPTVLRRLGLSQNDRVVSNVARLIPEKGHFDFLRAAERVARRFPSVRFLVVGEGSLRPDLENLAAEMGLSDRVRFLGHRRDVATLMQISEVVVLSSIREYFGNVLVEAAAMSKPVIATGVGGVPEIVVDGQTGLLVPPGDPLALAQAMERVLGDPDRASGMGRRAMALIEDRFSVASVAQATAEVYRDVLGGAG